MREPLLATQVVVVVVVVLLLLLLVQSLLKSANVLLLIFKLKRLRQFSTDFDETCWAYTRQYFKNFDRFRIFIFCLGFMNLAKNVLE